MFITTAIAVGYLLYADRQLEKEEKKIAASLPAPKKKPAGPTSIKIIEQLLLPFIEDKRSQQLQEMGPKEKSEEEKNIDKNLKASVALLGVATLGALIAPPLTYVALTGLAWTWIDVYKTAYKKMKQGIVGIEILDGIAGVCVIGLGYAVLGSISSIFYYGSRKLLYKTEDYSTQRLVNIFGDQPKTVWIVVNNLEVEIPFEQLEKGSIVSIHAGNMIPIDGEIVHGYALVDQQALTGESQPAEKKVGDTCFASTIILEGAIHIKVEKTGSETVTAQIGTILNNSIDFKEEMIAKGEAMSDNSTLPTLALGVLSMPWVGPIGSTIIFNASFGYNLRLVSPMLMLNFLTIASNRGILIKDGRSLELLGEIDTIVFDKTGTLTMNEPRVASIHTIGNLSEDELLAYAAAAEYKQSHPIALAIIKAATERQLEVLPIEETKYEVGYGIKVYVGTTIVHLGSARFMEMEDIEIPVAIKLLAEEGQRKGFSFVYVALNQQIAGAIELHPTIRPEAKRVIQELQAKNMSCYIISGDHLWPTEYLAKQLGIDNYFAEVLPEDKASLVQLLQKENKKVCFIGDGINDSIALKKADVSISLRGASTIATDTAQIILMKENLEQLPFIFDLGNQFEEYMNKNINLSVIPSLLTIGAVFLFPLSFAASIIINKTSLMVGIFNSVHPLIRNAQVEEESSPIVPTPTKAVAQQRVQKQLPLATAASKHKMTISVPL